jgi:hypothetical protein
MSQRSPDGIIKLSSDWQWKMFTHGTWWN